MVNRRIHAAMDRRECGRERQWRFGGEFVRQLHCLFEKIGVRHDTVNQAEAGGLI
jgi:hypothetical protein